ENVELPLIYRGVGKKERLELSEKALDKVGLAKRKTHKPSEMSGGQQQRVAIARGLAVDPDILFMDEPFGALDAITRMKLQDDILNISRQEKKTIIFVTHDIEEAVYLADRIVVMTPNPGKIKSIVTVPLKGHRERTASDFLEVRDKIFDLFHMKHDENIEYII
ncbi:MAG: ABC transporter ATP-binding protein, partial [Lachnospiraceae bacterium]|nr:ABC transporter ATP-binding protein [Lachnospiraceae bacterium]